MSRAAFRKAELTRRSRRPASAKQRHRLNALSKQAGLEPPRIYWSCDATDVIKRLESYLAQPMLEGFTSAPQTKAAV